MDTKVLRQLALEDEAINLGKKKYEDDLLKALQQEQGSLTQPVKELITQCIEPMVLRLAKYKIQNRNAKDRDLVTVLDDFDNMVIAFETARVMFNSYHTDSSLQTLSMDISNTLLADLNYREFKKAEITHTLPSGEVIRLTGKNYVENVIKVKNSQGTSKSTTMSILRAMMERRDVNATKWDKGFMFRLGSKLISFFVESTGTFELVSAERGKKVLRASDKVISWIEDRNSVLSVLQPIYLPMIVKPMPWEGIYSGGYLSAHRAMRLRMVRARNKESIKTLKGHNMENVYKAINAIQDTPWVINKDILELAEYLWEHSIDRAGLPSREPLPIPTKPWGELSDEEWAIYKDNPAHKEIIAEWKEKARDAHNANASSQSKRLSVRNKLWIADKFKDEEEIFFTYFTDWRGRVYPVQPDVNPQADDLGKALLLFKEGVEIGDLEGRNWLMIHGANCAGVDKVSFEDRIVWVFDNEEMILKTAEDPISTIEFWEDFDKPFGFVAFCKEWAGFREHGYEYKSRLPIAMDGSCNGLQHLSAMLKDPRGGKAVNLVPGVKPNDIYQEVADEVAPVVAADAANGTQEAIDLDGKITRSIVKRGVMTTPYGATKRGMVDQLKEDHGFTQKHSSYLAAVQWDAIGKVVVASRKAMGWFQDVAKILADHNLPMTWVTPAGFKVHHAYNKSVTKQIETYWGGMRLSLSIRNDVPDTIAKTKQANGIAPNIVHSYDAAHLQNTTCACLDEGITSFAFIHDSFGTHAGNSGKLARILREQFVEMYSGNALQDFADQLKEQLPPEVYAELPEVPEQGDLDLNQVLSSPYFFA